LKIIKYIPHKEINKQAWDNCVENAVNQIIYVYSWFLDVVSPNWDALVLGNYEAIMPLPQQKRFTLSYLAQPLFTQQLGVFYSELAHMNVTNDFLNAIPEKFKLIELNLNTYNIPANNLFQNKLNITCHLELNKPFIDIEKNYSAQIIRNIKKANKSNLAIDSEIKPQIIIDLFKNNRGKTIRKLKNKSYELLNTLCKSLENKQAITYLGVKNKLGIYIAGAIFIKYNDIAIFLFSGANAEAKTCGAMSLLINDFIKNNANSKYLLDFEGSNDLNLTRFYMGFGSKQVNYYAIKKNNLPRIIRWVKN
jgi:hypothetical protein